MSESPEPSGESAGGSNPRFPANGRVPPRQTWGILVLVAIGIVSLFGGSILALRGWIALGEAVRGQPTPARMTLEDLLDNGPPAGNGYVEVTDFVYGAHAVETTINSSPASAYIPVFPAAEGESRTVVAVVEVGHGKVDETVQRSTLKGLVSRQRLSDPVRKVLLDRYPKEFKSVIVVEPREAIPTRGRSYGMLGSGVLLAIVGGVTLGLIIRRDRLTKWFTPAPIRLPSILPPPGPSPRP